MRCLQLLLAIFLFSSSELCLLAQSSATAAQRNPLALGKIAQTLSAMGFQANGTLTDGNVLASVQLTGSVKALPGSAYSSGTFTSLVQLTNGGYEVRNDFQSANGSSTFVSGHGTPAFYVGNHVLTMSGHVTMITAPSQFPILELINAVVNPNYQVSTAQNAQIGGISAVHLHISNKADPITDSVTAQEWYFDSTTSLPIRWEFSVPDIMNAGHALWAASKDFANYQMTGGILIPTQITYSDEGKPQTVTTTTAVQFNLAPAPASFDPPQGGN
jgi:hypothetical protein